MTKVVRVAQVVGRMVGGGVEATVMNYYRCLDHSRVQFDFIIQNDSTVVPRDEIRSLGGHIYEVPSYKNPIAYIHACESVFRDIRPDIVHSNMNAVSVLRFWLPNEQGSRFGTPTTIVIRIRKSITKLWSRISYVLSRRYILRI